MNLRKIFFILSLLHFSIVQAQDLTHPKISKNPTNNIHPFLSLINHCTLRPDFQPTIMLATSVVIGDAANVDTVITIGELQNTDSFPYRKVRFRLSKSEIIHVNFQKDLESMHGKAIRNQDWKLTENDPFYFIFEYIGNQGVFLGNTSSSIGLQAVIKPITGTKGKINIKVSMQQYAGGQSNQKNDNDFAVIQYTNK